jgi:hypothetical protein
MVKSPIETSEELSSGGRLQSSRGGSVGLIPGYAESSVEPTMNVETAWVEEDCPDRSARIGGNDHQIASVNITLWRVAEEPKAVRRRTSPA